MSNNNNLGKAKKAKNDEFYTVMSDIENELQHYIHLFKDKVIYCNCDSPNSNFVKYFINNEKKLGYKKFIHTWYDPVTKTGSFNSPESIELLKECDIVVTNPPFSLAIEYLNLLVKYNKSFLFIGNKNAVAYKDYFKLIKENKMWLGVTQPKDFDQPSGSEKKQMYGLCYWFTNLPHKKHKEPMILYRNYNPTDYPFYDGTNIINVDKTKDIPSDWNEIMGIPISALDKLSPEQFEIIGMCNDGYFRGNVECKARINGKGLYARLLVKLKNPKQCK